MLVINENRLMGTTEGALREVVTKAENLDMVEVHKQVAQQQAEQQKQA